MEPIKAEDWNFLRNMRLGYSAAQLEGMTYWYQYYTGGRYVHPDVMAEATDAEGVDLCPNDRDPHLDFLALETSLDSRIARTPPSEELQVVRRLSIQEANPGLLVNDKDSFLDSNPM
jgi:hypothetical protein